MKSNCRFMVIIIVLPEFARILGAGDCAGAGGGEGSYYSKLLMLDVAGSISGER